MAFLRAIGFLQKIAHPKTDAALKKEANFFRKPPRFFDCYDRLLKQTLSIYLNERQAGAIRWRFQ
jgi:hypothetical protein